MKRLDRFLSYLTRMATDGIEAMCSILQKQQQRAVALLSARKRERVGGATGRKFPVITIYTSRIETGEKSRKYLYVCLSSYLTLLSAVLGGLRLETSLRHIPTVSSDSPGSSAWKQK